MPELWLHDGTAPRKARELYFHDGAAIRKVKEAWFHDGTAPRKIYSGAAIVNPLAGGSYVDDVLVGSTASVSVQASADGSIVVNSSGGVLANPNWFAPAEAGIGAGYYVRFRVTAGAATTNGAAAWSQLNVSRSISRTRGTLGSSSVTFVFEVATDAAGTNIVTSGNFTLTASVSS